MARYITELANDIAKSCPDLVENGCGNDNCVACLAFKLIGLGYQKQSNTADVVEVVRCRDCKNAKGNLISIDICHCLKYRDVRQGGDFCNYGEKREHTNESEE